MKLDIDCVRDTLLELESFPMGCYSVRSFSKSLKKHGEENVIYTLAKLSEADYIKAHFMMMESGHYFCDAIYDITFSGHQFLEKIRDHKLWACVKNVAGKTGSFAFDIISQIATNMLLNAISGNIISE